MEFHSKVYADGKGPTYGYSPEGCLSRRSWARGKTTDCTYDAWGNVLDESVSVPALATIRYRFHGREWSAATGLVIFRMRWYDPETGRWLSKDPIGLSGGLNLYAFCGDNTANFSDKLGLYPGDSYMKTVNGVCLNGDKVVNDIMRFYDAIDNASKNYFWVPKGFTSYMALLSLSGGPWGTCDFKYNEEHLIFYRDKFWAQDEFGNYIAGFQAGYANVPGLLSSVKLGGWLWSAVPGGEPIGDRESIPMINEGFKDGQRSRNKEIEKM